MATDQGPVVQSALLRSELVRLRRDSGLTQEQVAEHMEWSPSKVIRIESGSSFCVNDTEPLLAQLYLIIKSGYEEFRDSNCDMRKRSHAAAYRVHIGNNTRAPSIRNDSGKDFPRLFQWAGS